MAPVVDTIPPADAAAPVPVAEIKVKKLSSSGPTLRKRKSRSSRTSVRTSSMASDATSGSESSFNRTVDEYEPMENFYIWGCELTRSNDTHVAKYPVDAENEDPEFPEHHQLILKTAALGADAIDKERNVIEVKFVNASGGEQTLTLASLTTGITDTLRLDLTMSWSKGCDVTFKLIKGSGPVSLLGNHVATTHADEEADDSLFVPDAETTEAEESGMSTDGDEMDESEVKDLEADKEKPVA